MPIPYFFCKRCGCGLVTNDDSEAAFEWYKTHGANCRFTPALLMTRQDDLACMALLTKQEPINYLGC